MHQFLQAIWIPLMIAILNAFGDAYIWDLIGPGQWLSLIFRGVLGAWAAYLVIDKTEFGLPAACAAACCVPLVDHVIVKGGLFLVMYLTGYGAEALSVSELADHEHPLLLAYAGVIITYLLLLPVFVVFGLVGGSIAKANSRRGNA